MTVPVRFILSAVCPEHLLDTWDVRMRASLLLTSVTPQLVGTQTSEQRSHLMKGEPARWVLDQDRIPAAGDLYSRWGRGSVQAIHTQTESPGEKQQGPEGEGFPPILPRGGLAH